MGKANVSIANPELVYVPPSQQTCQGPVPKPGELLPEVAKQYLRDRLAYATIPSSESEAEPKDTKSKK